MQVSVETTSNIERRMTIGVPAQEIDQAVQKRLQETARTGTVSAVEGSNPFVHPTFPLVCFRAP